MTKRSGLDADFGPLADALGRVEGITGYIKTNQHISKAVRSIANAAANDIGDLMDAETEMMGYADAPLSHVYEYDAFRTGDFKGNRLFRFNINTKGGRDATVSFMFTQSQGDIATPRENVEEGLISLREESLEAFEEEDKRYTFRTQAISFEYGADVTVKSTKGPTGWLAIPQKFNPRPQFVRGSYNRNLELEYGGIHFGAFTNKWIKLTNTVPQPHLKRVEAAIDKMVKSNVRRRGTVAKKNFSVAFRDAEKQGLDHARRDLDRMYESVIDPNGGRR